MDLVSPGYLCHRQTGLYLLYNLQLKLSCKLTTTHDDLLPSTTYLISLSGARGSSQLGAEISTKLALSRHQVEILRECEEEASLTQLMAIAGRTDRTKFRNLILNPLLHERLIEMTIPEKPKSSKQKYRITQKGRDLINQQKG
jgi:predicted transcriptional regulator